MGRINNFLRVIINGHNKIRLKNKNFTLIANNCNGSLICHDLGIRYNSPFVNLYLEPKHFIKYLSNNSPFPNHQSINGSNKLYKKITEKE